MCFLLDTQMSSSSRRSSSSDGEMTFDDVERAAHDVEQQWCRAEVVNKGLEMLVHIYIYLREQYDEPPFVASEHQYADLTDGTFENAEDFFVVTRELALEEERRTVQLEAEVALLDKMLSQKKELEADAFVDAFSKMKMATDTVVASSPAQSSLSASPSTSTPTGGGRNARVAEQQCPMCSKVLYNTTKNSFTTHKAKCKKKHRETATD